MNRDEEDGEVGREIKLRNTSIHCLTITHTPTWDLWTAGYCVADLLLFRFGAQITLVAVLFVLC